MEIEIKVSNNYPYLLYKNKIFLRLYLRSSKRTTIILFFISIGLLILGLLTPYTVKVDSGTNIVLYNLNISFSIGFAFLLFSVISWYNLLRIKKRYLDSLKRFLKQNNGQEISLYINDSGVKYTNFEMVQEFKWTRFSSFTIYNTLLFFLVDGQVNPTFVVGVEDIQAKDFSQLTVLLKGRLPEGKSL